MNTLAASHTGRPAVASRALPRLAFVEDLNWPVPGSLPQKKPVRVPEVRAPGPDGPWTNIAPTLQ